MMISGRGLCHRATHAVRAEGARVKEASKRAVAVEPGGVASAHAGGTERGGRVARWALIRRLGRESDGSILPLTIFYGFLCLVLILLVVAASSLYLERKRLFTLADGAALAGSESFALADLSPTATGVHPALRTAAVRTAVDSYLEEAPDDRFNDLTLEKASTDDELSARVTLSAYWRPPVVSLLVPEGLRIEVTAVARTVFRRGGPTSLDGVDVAAHPVLPASRRVTSSSRALAAPEGRSAERTGTGCPRRPARGHPSRQRRARWRKRP